MHAVFLTFEYVGDRLAEHIDVYASEPSHDSGVISCSWMNDGTTIGAFYVFQSVDAAERFLNSARMRALATHSAVSDFYIRHFSVLNTTGMQMPAVDVAIPVADAAPELPGPVWPGVMEQVLNQPA